MKKRQLFIAKDSEGNKVLIDHIDKDDAADTKDKKGYFCPYCKKEVIPKMGEKNVWHFSHKGEVCEFLNIKSADKKTSDSRLNLNSTDTISLDSIDLGESCVDFLCVKCKRRFRKEGGVKWSDSEYICRDCFSGM